MKVAFGIGLIRPGCALLQAAMGGIDGIVAAFESEDWLVAPTEGMRVYEVTEGQLGQLVDKVSEAKGGD